MSVSFYMTKMSINKYTEVNQDTFLFRSELGKPVGAFCIYTSSEDFFSQYASSILIVLVRFYN